MSMMSRPTNRHYHWERVYRVQKRAGSSFPSRGGRLSNIPAHGQRSTTSEEKNHPSQKRKVASSQFCGNMFNFYDLVEAWAREEQRQSTWVF